MTSPARRAEQPRRLRTGMRGGVVLMLAWIALQGAFLLDVARPPPGAGGGKSTATTQVPSGMGASRRATV